ncbi:MAG: hypothetical protein QOI74_987 [Micromonosporaceae bacterium]|nr:hypothetical protein [Micromonosporaceae bacterium]
MRSRRSQVRTKVVALLLSLVALWAFAAFATLREGVNLLWVDTLDQKVDRPADSLITALEQERRVSLVYLGDRDTPRQVALAAARTRTDRARAAFVRLAGGADVRRAADATEENRIRAAFDRLSDLDPARPAIELRNVDRSRAANTFTTVIDTVFGTYGALARVNDPALAGRGRSLVALGRAREVLSREDALLSGMLAAKDDSAVERRSFTELVGARRFLYAAIEPELPDAELLAYRQLDAGSGFTALRSMEDGVVESGATATLPFTPDAWRAALDLVTEQTRELEQTLAASTLAQTGTARNWVLFRIALACGLGLIAVIVSIIISLAMVRSLGRQLERLRIAALELAGERLPRAVERIRRGEDVDTAAAAPPLPGGPDEIGMVADAFNAVQRTALRIAVEQAELRRGVRDVFLNLARRTQALVHRQLTVLDAMERRENEPEVLDDLFRIDHLATRMRRNAENLIVLSGAVPGRGWRKPVSLVDVVRGAVAEVEDYGRVSVLPIASAALVGRAVGDVIHLLAELVENATSFAPPDTEVQVGGQKVAKGYAIEIEDRGLGMSEEELARANEQLADPPEFSLSGTAQLGLYVVGRLARRHDIRVRLRDSPYGGTTAIVLIPANLVVDVPSEVPAAPRERPAAIAAGLASAGPGVPPARTSTSMLMRVDRTVRSRPIEPVVAEPAANEPLSSLVEPSMAVTTTPTAPASPGMNAVPVVRGFTDNGLPRRVKQANLAAPLRQQAPEPEAEPSGPGATTRSPEEIRTMMASYQRGTKRGRSGSADDPTPVAGDATGPGSEDVTGAVSGDATGPGSEDVTGAVSGDAGGTHGDNPGDG